MTTRSRTLLQKGRHGRRSGVGPEKHGGDVDYCILLSKMRAQEGRLANCRTNAVYLAGPDLDCCGPWAISLRGPSVQI